MRHDPASGALVIMLRSLKMYGMAQAVDELAQQGAPAFEAAIPILSQLLKAETAEREVRSMAYQLKAGRFPAYRDLAGFDFASSEVNEALVRRLHRCDFIASPSTTSCWSVGPIQLHNTHLAIMLKSQRILTQIIRRRLPCAALVSGLHDGFKTQVIDANRPGSALTELMRRQDPLCDQAADCGFAHIQLLGSLIQCCLTALRSLPLAMRRDVPVIAQHAHPRARPAIAAPCGFAGPVEHGGNSLVR